MQTSPTTANAPQPPKGLTPAQLEYARAQIMAFLLQNHIKIPNNTTLKQRRNTLILGSVTNRIEIDRVSKSISIRSNDWLADLIVLHFACAGTAFNVLTFGFVVFMFITYITRLLLCDSRRNGKNMPLR